MVVKENLLLENIAKGSHEVRTLMSGIIGLVDLLDDTELNQVQKEYLGLLKFTSGRLLSIMNSALDFAKIESGKHELVNDEFNLVKLIENILDYFKYKTNKKVLEFNYKIDNTIPKIVIGDSAGLTQILFNLIENAIKFTEKGSIGVEVKKHCESSDAIGFTFSVKDTGIGIGKEDMDSIFEEFNQLDSLPGKENKGAGLGLPISKRIVELMGGHMEVYSELGKGSEFKFYIEFLKEDTKEFKKKTLNLDKGIVKNKKHSKLNILVAEDDLIGQKIIKSILEKNKWDPTIVSNGKEALEEFKNNSFQVILMDIYMPVMDGFESARKIREIEKQKQVKDPVPIIALTAAYLKEERKKCMEVGIDEYILKPIRKKTLYEIIDEVLMNSTGIKEINLEKLLDRIDGDRKVFKELLEDLMSEDYEKEHLGNIRKYLKEKDTKNLTKQIHKFRGSISNFDRENMMSILEKMSLKVKEEKFNELEELYKELEMEFKATKILIKEFYNRKFLDD